MVSSGKASWPPTLTCLRKVSTYPVVLLSEATQLARVSMTSCGIQLALLLAEKTKEQALPFVKEWGAQATVSCGYSA